jgi:hypothetical protein
MVTAGTLKFGGSSGTTLTSGGNVSITGPASAGTVALRPQYWYGSVSNVGTVGSPVASNGISSNGSSITLGAGTFNVSTSVICQIATLTAGNFAWSLSNSPSSVGALNNYAYNASASTQYYTLTAQFTVVVGSSSVMTIGTQTGFSSFNCGVSITQVL